MDTFRSWDYDVAISSGQYQDDVVHRAPIPSREAMAARWGFRQGIREETLQHRRIHRHGGMGDTGRNISFVLRDRERFGAIGVTLQRRRRSEDTSDASRSTTATTTTTTTTTTATTGALLTAENGRSHVGRNGTVDERGNPPGTLRRRVSYPMIIRHEIQTFAEYCSVIRYHSAFFHHLGGDDEPGEGGERPSSSRAVSTISIAFSSDAHTMASTHGDHTVKITCCSTGRLLETLEGHPRTPWTVKYHPSDPYIVASGCLGHQVRVWNWKEKACIQMIRLEFAIISLSFHPSGQILAIANGTKLHFWGYASSSATSATTAEQDRNSQQPRPFRGMLTEVEQRHMLRCVHFPPDGNTIIVGGVNPPTEGARNRGRSGISGGGMSFYLRLWDFNFDAALRPYTEGAGVGLQRRAISNPRTFVPRALLYNDGGFDVSPDGKVLCACAEYWLPEGVDSAMELLQDEELGDESDDDSCREDGVDRTDKSSSSPGNNYGDGGNQGRSSPPARENSDASAQAGGRMHDSSNTLSSTRRSITELTPRTPPNPSRPHFTLSPPSPPGRRFVGGLGQAQGRTAGAAGVHPFPNAENQNSSSGTGAAITPPPPPGMGSRPPHPLSIISSGPNYPDVTQQNGRFVPHVVTISLDTSLAPGRGNITSVARGYRPRLGQLLEACPLDGAKASAVTCVKFSPSTDFCLIGYGVREPVAESGGHFHPVTALYRVRGGMTHVSTMLSGDDDVNIARFHPDSGYGFVYGTKQGRVRVLSPRPWNFYNC